MIVWSRKVRTDWPRLLDNIRKTGMSLEDIAAVVGVGRSTLHDYCDERNIEPAHWTGQALRQLWSQRTGLDQEETPVITVAEYKINPIRGSISHSDRMQQHLLQLDLAWNSTSNPAPADEEPAPQQLTCRYRVGLARDVSEEGAPLRALVVHDEEIARRVQKAPHFVGWMGEWVTADSQLCAVF